MKCHCTGARSHKKKDILVLRMRENHYFRSGARKVGAKIYNTPLHQHQKYRTSGPAFLFPKSCLAQIGDTGGLPKKMPKCHQVISAFSQVKATNLIRLFRWGAGARKKRKEPTSFLRK
eukprot:GEMP01120769.1.p1 GENE.GEMP01120769.1~~GEMP01120769.1.p1  ORF type:complete len:118 (-),score=7.08 GEMP01120769.1:8-361(-)